MAKSKKELALEGITPKEREAYDAIEKAGKSGIAFDVLADQLGISTSSKNMLYTRVGKLKNAGLVKSEKDGREVTYKAT